MILVTGGLGRGAEAAWRGAGGLHTWSALGAVIAVVVQGLVSYPLYMPATAGAFWVLLGVVSTHDHDS
mgnify:CR=1 FL=1